MFSPGEVERGKETAFQSEAFVAPQCPRHGLIALGPLQEGKREDGKLRKGKPSQEEGADPCRSIPPAQPISGWVKLRMPQLQGPTAWLSELGNSRVAPHSSPSSHLHWVDVLKEGVILVLDQNLLLAPSQSTWSRAAGTQGPSEAPKEVGRSRPGKVQPSRTCPGFPSRCHQHWEGSDRLWSSPG